MKNEKNVYSPTKFIKKVLNGLIDKHHSTCNIMNEQRVDSNFGSKAIQVRKWNVLEEAFTFFLSSPWRKCKQALLHTVYLLRNSWGGGGEGLDPMRRQHNECGLLRILFHLGPKKENLSSEDLESAFTIRFRYTTKRHDTYRGYLKHLYTYRPVCAFKHYCIKIIYRTFSGESSSLGTFLTVRSHT